MAHWYSPATGKLVDKVPKKSGDGMKDTTMPDARKLNLRPSVTGINDVVGKPQLINWFKKTAFEFAWNSAQTPIPFDDAWIAYGQEQAIARDNGSKCHAQVEAGERTEFTAETLDWLAKNYEAGINEVSFCTPRFGGKVDYIGIYGSKRDLLDFKFVTKSRDPYDTELWQMSAYNEYMDGEFERVINLYVDQNTGKILLVKEWSNDELTRGLNAFHSALSVWEQVNNFDTTTGGKLYE